MRRYALMGILILVGIYACSKRADHPSSVTRLPAAGIQNFLPRRRAERRQQR